MGRHAQQHPRRRWPLALAAALLAVAVAAGLLVWQRWDDTSTTAAGCPGGRTVEVQVTPELGELTESLLAGDRALADACITADVVAQEPVQTVADLGALDAAELPDVWVPDSASWLARVGSGGRAGAEVPGTLPEPAGQLGSTPLVLATSRAAADALGWSVTPPSWGQALTSGRPLAAPGLGTASEGLLALAAARTSLGGGPEADNAVVAAVLAAARGATPPVEEAVAAVTGGGADAPVVAMTEQEALVLARDDADVAVVYPADGSPVLDNPVLRVGSPEPAQRAAVDAVVATLTSPDAATAARRAGFRDTTGQAPDGAGGDSGVSVAAPASLLLDPAVVGQLLTRVSGLATPSRLLAVVDVSTSMSAAAGDGSRATLARDAAKSALTLFPDSAAIGLWVFAAELQGPADGAEVDWLELVPQRTLDADVDGRPQRAVLSAALDTVPDRLTGGGTGLYDTTLAAVRASRASYDPTAVNTVVVVTDGTNEDSAGIQLDELLQTLTAEADPQRPVEVVAVGLGPDADLDALEQVAGATGGGAYSAVDPEDLQTVLFDALANRD
ncbi:substrate-binding domain-containing protein [Goekera deserti]|uniref:substrate-binding domain-containing protein n=1 Tax=Goekera deserti TaxID=2497753 RepID=UPI001F44FF56|nr:substrate-binding domain-containing protein [Goekera deserti]